MKIQVTRDEILIQEHIPDEFSLFCEELLHVKDFGYHPSIGMTGSMNGECHYRTRKSSKVPQCKFGKLKW